MENKLKLLFFAFVIILSIIGYRLHERLQGNRIDEKILPLALVAFEEIKGSIPDKKQETWLDYNKPAVRMKDAYGIVTCAGNYMILEITSSLLWIRELEKRNNLEQMGVDWFYVGDDEVSPEMRYQIQEKVGGIEFIDCSKIYKNSNLLRGFPIKAFALQNTKFRHVAFLDSDSIPIYHPSELFSSPGYKEKGNIFWPDFLTWGPMKNKVLQTNRLFRNFVENSGQSKKDLENLLNTPEAESGQFFIDTVRFEVPVHLSWLMNERKNVFYKFTYGDKNLFMIGFFLAGMFSLYNQVPYEPYSFLNVKRRHEAIGQRDPADGSRIMYVHRTHQKRNCLSNTNPCIINAEKGYKELWLGYPVPTQKISSSIPVEVMDVLKFCETMDKEMFPIYQTTQTTKKLQEHLLSV